MRIVLLGDSIFDNAPYVEEGKSVSEILRRDFSLDADLLAVDGDVTTDMPDQLRGFPEGEHLAFVSCGGNDALCSIYILEEKAITVGHALEQLSSLRQSFRRDYQQMLAKILEKTSNLVLCTIYNHIPGLSASATTALALFNEVILEEAFRRNLSVLDLRHVCTELQDYSPISPIEPSFQGGRKIAAAIDHISNNFTPGQAIHVYTSTGDANRHREGTQV